jgi:hypothetical protein
MNGAFKGGSSGRSNHLVSPLCSTLRRPPRAPRPGTAAAPSAFTFMKGIFPRSTSDLPGPLRAAGPDVGASGAGGRLRRGRERVKR